MLACILPVVALKVHLLWKWSMHDLLCTFVSPIHNVWLCCHIPSLWEAWISCIHRLCNAPWQLLLMHGLLQSGIAYRSILIWLRQVTLTDHKVALLMRFSLLFFSTMLDEWPGSWRSLLLQGQFTIFDFIHGQLESLDPEKFPKPMECSSSTLGEMSAKQGSQSALSWMRATC